MARRKLAQRLAGLCVGASAILTAYNSNVEAQSTASDNQAITLYPDSVEPTAHWPSRSCKCQTCCPGDTVVRPDSPAMETRPGEAPAAAPQRTAEELATAEALTYVPNMIGDSIGLTHSQSQQVRIITRQPIHEDNSVLPKSTLKGIYQHYELASSVDRGDFGLEYAFCNNQYSVEIRSSLNGYDLPGQTDTEFGNLATNFKALLHQDETCAVSAGLSFQWVTGPTPANYPDDNHRVGPFVGFLYQDPCETYFVHGFEQLDIPWDDDDQLQLLSSIGFGYWLYKDPSGCHCGVTRVAPTLEFHLYTPLGDDPNGNLAGLDYNDVVNMTLGTTVILANNATVAVGFALPLTSHEDFDWEFQIQFNWFFGNLGAGAGGTSTVQ